MISIMKNKTKYISFFPLFLIVLAWNQLTLFMVTFTVRAQRVAWIDRHGTVACSNPIYSDPMQDAKALGTTKAPGSPDAKAPVSLGPGTPRLQGPLLHADWPASLLCYEIALSCPLFSRETILDFFKELWKA